jgi:hypothetical protein
LKLNLLGKAKKPVGSSEKSLALFETSSHTIDEPETHHLMSHELSSPVTTGFSFIIM